MITLKFETKHFRVQISGKTAWIERSERGRWVFRGQHTVPVDADGLRRRKGTIMLAAVVRHFAAHGGDQSLREALAGAHTEETEGGSRSRTLGRCSAATAGEGRN